MLKEYPLAYNPILEYWNEIENGLVVSEKVRRMYRQLAADVYNQSSVYEYSPTHANHAIEFIENYCKHSKGKWGGKPIELELWQKAFIAAAFGFVHKIDGTRRYREVLVVVARKNGKSTVASGIGLYLQIADGEPGAEVYAAATKKDQAKLVWLEAKRMVNKSPSLRKRIKPLVGDLVGLTNDSSFKPLGADSETLDGLNVHGAMMDEIHAWKDKNLYDVIVDGTSSREQPLIVMITTAGTVRGSVYDQKYDEAKDKINKLDFVYADGEEDPHERFLPIIYELDDRKEWVDPECWKKANPGLGSIKQADQLATKVAKAKANPMLIKNLLTKDFNIPETSEEAWLTYEEAYNDATYDIDQLRNSYAVGGGDLSSTTDLTCATLLVMKPNDPNIYAVQQYFLPEENIEQRVKEDKIPYDIYADRGWLTLCVGNKIDYKDVTAWFVKMHKEYDITPVWIGYDPYDSKYWVDEMTDLGFDMRVVRQGALTLSQPMKEIAADFAAKRINYNYNQLTLWNLMNTNVKHDDNDNIRPVKGKNQRARIDGTVSILNAYTILYENMTDFKALI
nr:terminase TerL endonuclease subunit [Paenibacillus harenae]